MSRFQGMELRCPKCSHAEVCGAAEMTARLRAVGMLRRARDAEPDLLVPLFESAAPRMACSACGHEGLAVKAADDRGDDWDERRCEQCGEPISAARLAAMPRATLCLACQSKDEAGQSSGRDDRRFCPKCGEAMEVRAARAGISRYEWTCPQCGPRRKRSVSGAAWLVAAVLSAAAAVSGCVGSSSEDVETPVPPLADQVEDVRAGRGERIYVPAGGVGDEELERIAGLTNLKLLELDEAELSDAQIERLAGAVNLELLVLRAARVGDDGAVAISRLPNLRVLNLPRGEFTDGGLAEMARLERLELLRFGTPNVTDEGLKHVAKLRNLRFLHLIDVPITDKGLEHLRAMTRLESFYLDGGQATDAGLERLIEALPHLHFHKDQQHLDRDPKKGTHKH
jgi:predicted RNA-binding Zn-ribbon protein involved in translation (DUF1610 family)